MTKTFKQTLGEDIELLAEMLETGLREDDRYVKLTDEELDQIQAEHDKLVEEYDKN